MEIMKKVCYHNGAIKVVWRAFICRIGRAAVRPSTDGFARSPLRKTGRIDSADMDRAGRRCPMKRVKAACILQTLVFSQKDDAGFTREQALRMNREEVNRYKDSLKRTNTRYQILDETEQEDGSVLIHVRKQYNDRADVSEYFV